MNPLETIFALFVPFFDWVMTVAPGLGFAVFLGWAIWKISTLWAGKFLKIDLRFDIIDDRLREHDVKIEAVMEGQHKLEVALTKVEAKIETLAVRMDEKFAAVDLKFQHVDDGFKHLEEKIDLRFKRLEDKFDAQHEVNKEILSILRGHHKNPPMTLVYPET